jgi:hypothetical protein
LNLRAFSSVCFLSIFLIRGNYCESGNIPKIFYEIGNVSSEHNSFTMDSESTSTDVEDNYKMVLPMSRSSRQDPAHLESNHSTSYALGPLQEKRHLSSARETLSLHGRRLKQIRAYLKDHRLVSNSSNRRPTKSTGEPYVYGLDHHYQFMNMWGATCARVHQLKDRVILRQL